MSTATCNAARPDALPASKITAPPIRSNVFVIREARLLEEKLPVSSVSAGMCFSSTSPSLAARGRIWSSRTPRAPSTAASVRWNSGRRRPICKCTKNSPWNGTPITTAVRILSSGRAG